MAQRAAPSSSIACCACDCRVALFQRVRAFAIFVRDRLEDELEAANGLLLDGVFGQVEPFGYLALGHAFDAAQFEYLATARRQVVDHAPYAGQFAPRGDVPRSEEHTSELQSLMRNSYAVFCLKK